MNYNINQAIDKAIFKKKPRSKFTQEEDIKLTQLVENYGDNDWQIISNQMPGRNVRQCRDRWRNYLSPDVVNGPWSNEEDDLLNKKYDEIGPSWKHIASFFPSRTDINIKSRWNLLQRKIKKEELKKKRMSMNFKVRSTIKYKKNNLTTTKNNKCNIKNSINVLDDKKYPIQNNIKSTEKDYFDYLLMDIGDDFDIFFNSWF